MTEEAKKKILIIEDDFYISDLYRRAFSEDGFIVDTAEDGVVGRDKSLSLKPDLILLDIMIPKINGLDLLKKLKAENDLAATKIVILSNLGQDPVVREAMDSGADGYLIKSQYTPAEIVNEVNTFFHK